MRKKRARQTGKPNKPSTEGQRLPHNPLYKAHMLLVKWGLEALRRGRRRVKKCSPQCPAVCDFCIHYAYNGGNGKDIPPEVFIGDGFCKIDGSNRWPEYGCLNFVCFNWIRSTGSEQKG